MKAKHRKALIIMAALLIIAMQAVVVAPSAFAALVDPDYTAPIMDPALQSQWTTTIPNALMSGFTLTPYAAGSAGATAISPTCGVTEDCYTISVRSFLQNLGLVDEVTRAPLQTTVYGYGTQLNGPGGTSIWYAPGPTFKNTSNRPTRVTWLNELPNVMPPNHDPTYDGGPNAPNNYPYNRIVTHVHGAHVTDDSDGDPEAWYDPGFKLTGTSYTPSIWGPAGTFRYPNTQEAGTVWYHDHASGLTHLNVGMGMAGFFLITDDNEKCLQGQVVTGCTCTKALPTDPYEVGFALQDRNFWPNGQIALPDQPIRDLLSPTCQVDALTGLIIPSTCPTVQFSKAADGHLIPYDATIVDPLLRGPFAAVSGTLEYFGNMPLVNGAVYGKYDVEPRVYRMRFVGGTDSRTWVIQLATRPTGTVIPFWQIGTDQGFLNNPVSRQEMLLMPGERFDVLVDFKNIPVGTKIVLKNLGPDAPFNGVFDPLQASTVIPEIMEFNVVALNGAVSDVASPTAALNLRPLSGTIVSLPTPTIVRNVSLIEITDKYGRIMPTIDSRGYLPAGVPVTERPKLNDIEQWDIINTTADAHPMHLHLVSFQVIDRQLFDPLTFGAPVTDTVNNIFTSPTYSNAAGSAPVPPDAWDAGWKDTVMCPPGYVTRVKAKFDIGGLYVWHCHILSHEEHDMMRAFVVTMPATSVTLTAPVASSMTGTAITFHAQGSGMVGGVSTQSSGFEYRFSVVSPGNVTTITRDWGAAPAVPANMQPDWTWIPYSAGTFTIQVDARQAGSANALGEVSASLVHTVTVAPAAPVADILWRNSANGANFAWYMNGVTRTSGASLPTVADLNWKIVARGDFNGDGIPDLVWRNSATGDNIVWYMNGVSQLGAVALPPVFDLAWTIVGAADFNADGKPDLLWRNTTTGNNLVWYMNGVTYVSTAGLPVVTDLAWTIVGIGDFNADGNPDLLWRNTTTGNDLVWYMNGVTQAGLAGLPVVTDLTWAIVGTGDFNADGKPDLLWRNTSTGADLVWYMNGVTQVGTGVVDSVTDVNWKIVAN